MIMWMKGGILMIKNHSNTNELKFHKAGYFEVNSCLAAQFIPFKKSKVSLSCSRRILIRDRSVRDSCLRSRGNCPRYL